MKFSITSSITVNVEIFAFFASDSPRDKSEKPLRNRSLLPLFSNKPLLYARENPIYSTKAVVGHQSGVANGSKNETEKYGSGRGTLIPRVRVKGLFALFCCHILNGMEYMKI